MKRNAFTMLELVMVIIVLGILAALAIPRLDRDLKQEAADNILSAIRYTQHLALLDNKHKFDNPKWHQRFWHITFSTCTGTDRYYMIGSDDNMSNSSNAFFSQNEAALDPANGKPYFWTNGTACGSGTDTSSASPSIFLSKKYGIDSITAGGGCSNTSANLGHIGFDHLGRPHVGFSTSTKPDYSSYMHNQCQFTFSLKNGESFTIKIEPETGYAYIDGYEDS